jgi:hypothetical protein
MHKLSFTLFIFCLFAGKSAEAQTQSIIYDAATLMNVKHGVNGLKIPTSNSNIIVDPLTNKATDMGDEDAVIPATLKAANSSKNSMLAILKRNAGLASTASEDDVRTAYAANPFLKNILDGSIIKDTKAQNDLKEIETNNESGSIGNNILGNLVNGTADFLIKRAQQEISITVFEKLKKILERYPELDTLFPKTCALIKPIEPYEYNKALEAFKAAIHEDLKNFIPRISLLYDIPRYSVLNKRIPSLTLVFTASALLGELHDKTGFAEAVYQLSEHTFLDEQNNYASLLKTIAIISNSFTDKKLSDDEDVTRNYIDKGFIKSATLNDPALYKDLAQMYLGLLWQHTHNITFTTSVGSKSFGELLEHWNTSDISKALTKVNSILDGIIAANAELGALKESDNDFSKATGKSIVSVKRFTIYAKMVSQLLGFSDLYNDAANSIFVKRIQEIREYVPAFTNQTMTMIKDFQEEEYSLGISDFSALLKTASDYLDKIENDKTLSDNFVADFKTKLDAVKTQLDFQKNVLVSSINALPDPGADVLVNNAIEAEKQELLAKKERIQSALDNISYQAGNKKVIVFKLSKVIEYANLLASITKAENSAAVESLLETYALPVGSSRVKKATSFNIAVNAYVGGFGGRSNNSGDGFTNTYGLTAPIGFAFSKGFQKAGSISFFLGVFDIGGTIRYKLDNNGKYQQDISFARIVSPSVHAVYGFPWYLPLSVGIGSQWISPTTANSNKIDLKATFNAFIAVDIPLFNLKAIKHK